MYESTNGLYRPRQPGWFTILAMTLCLTAATLLAACGGLQDSTAAAEVRSDRERGTPSAGNADLAGLVDGNIAFSFDLY